MLNHTARYFILAFQWTKDGLDQRCGLRAPLVMEPTEPTEPIEPTEPTGPTLSWAEVIAAAAFPML